MNQHNGKRRTTMASCALLLLAAAGSGCGMTHTSDTPATQQDTATYLPASIYVELDSDWDLADENALTTETQNTVSAAPALAPSPDFATAPLPATRPPRMPQHTRLVTIEQAALTVAGIGFVKLPPPRNNPHCDRDASHQMHPGMTTSPATHGKRPPRCNQEKRGSGAHAFRDKTGHSQADGQGAMQPDDHEAGRKPAREPGTFDEMITGPLSLALLTDSTVPQLATIALQDGAPYQAVLLPGRETPYELRITGSWADSVTQFAFTVAVPVTRPIVVPLRHDRTTGEARIRLPLARALVRMHLPDCIDFATAVSDQEGRYDLTNSTSCDLRRLLPPPARIGQPPRDGWRQDGKETGSPRPETRPTASINCVGSDSFCSTLEANPRELRTYCITAIETGENGPVMTVTEDAQECLHPPRHHR